MMAFFFTMPISRMMPINAMTSRSSLNRTSARIAPTPADGNVDRMVIGWMKLSYNIPSTMYTVTMAARIRIDSLASDDSNAWPVPWKLGSTLAGMPSSWVTCLIRSTAAPSDAPGARLKDSVTTGNWLWWLMAMGDGIETARTNPSSGAGGIDAAPVSAVFVPASAMVDARLADAEFVGTYMSSRAPL